MRNLRMLFFSTIGLFGLAMHGQNVASTSGLTSGGLEAGAVGTQSTYYGYQAGKLSSSGPLFNTFIGHQSGKNNTTGNYNTHLGYGSGINGQTAIANTYIGMSSGNTNTGNYNVGLGYYALTSATGANVNYTTALGGYAGEDMTGNNNVLLGFSAGHRVNGGDNVLIGYKAGFSPNRVGPFTGSGNVLIGNEVGSSAGLSNKLMIDNQNTATPLIWGDFALDQLKLNGKTGIGLGTATFPTLASGINVSTYNLFVKGGILTEEVRVTLSSAWADYVFEKDYDLKPLHEVEQFITTNGHLPNVPSAKQVKKEGVELGEMAKIQQEKIEELTLYLIQQNKEIEAMKAQIKALTDKK